MNGISTLVARIRGRGPHSRCVIPPGSNPAVQQAFNAAQMKLVLQLDELNHDDRVQAALLLESFTSAGVFSAAQQSMISSLLSLEHDDLMRTLFDCASTIEARYAVGEALLQRDLSRL